MNLKERFKFHVIIIQFAPRAQACTLMYFYTGLYLGNHSPDQDGRGFQDPKKLLEAFPSLYSHSTPILIPDAPPSPLSAPFMPTQCWQSYAHR